MRLWRAEKQLSFLWCQRNVAGGTMLANMKGLLLGMALAATIPTLDKASAQSIETGTGLLCDQPSEVERFFSLLEDDLQTAIEQVNAEAHKASACAVVQVAFVKGNEVAAGRHKNGSYKVVEVVVVAIFNDQWLSVTPVQQYIAVNGPKEEDA